MGYYYNKTVVTKNRLYVWKYSTPVYFGFPKTSRDLETYEKRLEGTKESNSIYRSRMTAKLLVETNYTPYMKFVTFTYAEAPADRDQVVKDFNKFARRYKRAFGYTLKFLYTMERGTKSTKRWHVHAVLFHERFIPVKDLKRVWSHGFVKINAVDDAVNIGLYLVKYITKAAVELNKKGYIASHGLKQPSVERTPIAQDVNKSHADFYNKYSRTFIDRQGKQVTQSVELFEFNLINN